jgi:hypothetical protein
MRRFLLAIVAVMGLAGPAFAQVSPEWVRCVNESGTYSMEVAMAAGTADLDNARVIAEQAARVAAFR